METKFFPVLNINTFIASGLPSVNLSLTIEGLGQKEIMVTRGDRIGVLIDDVFLLVSLLGQNPFDFEGYSVFQDNNDILWIGIEIAD